MRVVAYQKIKDIVKDLCLESACDLPADVATALENASALEKSPLAQSILHSCLENARIAAKTRAPLCQDTGFAVFFVEIGSDVWIEGGTLPDAINEGTAAGYLEGYLRASIVDDPLFERENTRNNTPAIIYLSIVPGETLRISLAPKGGGSENMGACAMLKPSDGPEGVVKFVVKTVIDAGGNPCPPTIVGVGVGGTMEMAALLAKKALLRRIGSVNPDPGYARLEKEILDKINASGIGPQGLGGAATSLAVHIETHPCHMASLPVAVTLNCHAARHATRHI